MGWESGWAKIRTHHDVTTAIPRVLHEHSTSRGLFVSPCAWCRRSMNSIALRPDSGGGNRPQRVFQHLVMGGLSLHSDSSIDDCNRHSRAFPPVVVGNHCKCTKCLLIHMPSYARVRAHTHTHARTHARTHTHTHIHTYARTRIKEL